MDQPAISLFNPNHLEVLHEAEIEDEEDDAEECRRIEEEVAQGLQGAFDDLELDLEGDESDDDENQRELTHPRNDYHFMTSTPYIAAAAAGNGVADLMQTQEDIAGDDKPDNGYNGAFQRLNPEETVPGTPSSAEPTAADIAANYHQMQRMEEERRYLHAENRQSELEILYQARGREINRLNTELMSVREGLETELRVTKHNCAIITGEKENLMANVEQLQDLLHGANDENRTLRSEIETLKNSVSNNDKSKSELLAQVESSEHMISSLQSQLIELQKSDAMLKARQQHDSIVRSLKERHENETYILQQEVDRLNVKTRRYENDLEDMKTRMLEQQRIHEEAIMAKSDSIKELNNRIEALNRKNTQLVSDTSNMEVSELRLQLRNSDNESEKLRFQVQNLQENIMHLKSELNGYEATAMAVASAENEGDSSMIALGIASPKDSSGNNSTQVREALQRSLIGNKTKREELEKIRRELQNKDSHINDQNLKIEGFKDQIIKLKSQLSQQSSDSLREKEIQIEKLRNKIDTNIKCYEIKMNEKSEIINNLNRRLEDNQKKVSDLLSEKISNQSYEHQLASLGMSLEETKAINENLKAKIESYQSDLKGYESLIRRTSSGGDIIDGNTNSSDLHQKIRLQLQKSLASNNEKRGQISKLQENIVHLKEEISMLQAKSNKSDEGETIKQKYATLKKKVKIYQKHCQNKENFYVQERKAMEEEYKSTLLALKNKMEQAYITKEQQVEVELLEMKDHFNGELQKLAKLRPTTTSTTATTPMTSTKAATLEGIRQNVVSYMTSRIGGTAVPINRDGAGSVTPNYLTPTLLTPRNGDDDDDDDTSCGISEISKIPQIYNRRYLNSNHELPSKENSRPNSASQSEQLNKLFEKAQEEVRNKLQKPLSNINV